MRKKKQTIQLRCTEELKRKFEELCEREGLTQTALVTKLIEARLTKNN